MPCAAGKLCRSRIMAASQGAAFLLFARAVRFKNSRGHLEHKPGQQGQRHWSNLMRFPVKRYLIPNEISNAPSELPPELP